MPTEVIVTLNEISCRNAGDLYGGTDPYIWPMLVWIDSKVNSTCIPSEAFRENLGWGMKRGQTAAIPADVGVLRGIIDGELLAMFSLCRCWKGATQATIWFGPPLTRTARSFRRR